MNFCTKIIKESTGSKLVRFLADHTHGMMLCSPVCLSVICHPSSVIYVLWLNSSCSTVHLTKRTVWRI